MSTQVILMNADPDERRITAKTTWQFNVIVLLHSGLDSLFQDAADVLVAGNHLIYPVKGQPDVRQAPDVYVAFGVTKVPRGSYRLWEEGTSSRRSCSRCGRRTRRKS